jgi:hypothetical protein
VRFVKFNRASKAAYIIITKAEHQFYTQCVTFVFLVHIMVSISVSEYNFQRSVRFTKAYDFQTNVSISLPHRANAANQL